MVLTFLDGKNTCQSQPALPTYPVYWLDRSSKQLADLSSFLLDQIPMFANPISSEGDSMVSPFVSAVLAVPTEDST